MEEEDIPVIEAHGKLISKKFDYKKKVKKLLILLDGEEEPKEFDVLPELSKMEMYGHVYLSTYITCSFISFKYQANKVLFVKQTEEDRKMGLEVEKQRVVKAEPTDKDRWIARQNSLSHSTDIVVALLNNKKLEHTTGQELAKLTTLIAEDFEKWIFR